MIQNLKADIYKCFKFKIIYFHIIIAVFCTAFVTFMLSRTLFSNYDKISAFVDVFSIAFPFFSSIVISMDYINERQAGFKMLLTQSISKYKAHIANLFVLLFQGLFASFIAVFIFKYLGEYFGFAKFSIKNYVFTIFLLFMVNLYIYPFLYFLAFEFGTGVCIFTTSMMTFASAILLNVVGDKIWFYYPWAIGSRLTKTFVLTRFTGDSFFVKPDIVTGVYMLFFWIIFVNIIFYFWCGNFEGKSIYSE